MSLYNIYVKYDQKFMKSGRYYQKFLEHLNKSYIFTTMKPIRNNI